MKKLICLTLALVIALSHGTATIASGEASGSGEASLPEELADLPTIEAEPWVEVSSERIGLEGPVFDSEGNLYVCNSGLAYAENRIMKIDPAGNVSQVFEDELTPLGLAFHEDGRLFVVCKEGMLLTMDVSGGNVTSVTPTYEGKTLALNDLAFTEAGDLLVTDWQGTEADPIGGVYLLTQESGYEEALVVADRLPGPNGISLSPDGQTLWVGMTNAQAVYRIDLSYEDGRPIAEKAEAIYENTGSGQPDSNKTDSEGNLYQAIIMGGRAIVFSSEGEPIANVVIPDSGLNMSANLAIKPGTSEGYLLTAGFGSGSWIYTFETLAPAKDAGTAASDETSVSASGEASGGVIPSGGSFGDVKTHNIYNAVILISGDEVDVTENATDIFEVAEGGEIGNVVSGLYLQNDSVKNSINEATGTTQGISGVVVVDSDAVIGGTEGYYDVEENGDPLAMPTVTEGDEYNTVIILGDEDGVFDRDSAEVEDGAAVALGGGTEDNVLTVENSYLWTRGFKRASIFADDGQALLVVRDSRIVCPGAENYKKGWQALYGGARDTLLQNGDCWFYNSSIVTEGWGALSIDSSPNLSLYVVNSDVDVLGGGYVTFTPGDGDIHFYGVDADSAQYGVFVTGNSSAYLHSLDDLDDEAAAHMTEADKAAAPVTEDGMTHINADYAAYLTHQGMQSSPTVEGYLFAENTVLSTETEYTIADNSHFLNDENSGTSWFWTEFWRGSTCLSRSANGTFEFDNVKLESRTGVVFRTVVNWEGPSRDYSFADDVEVVGNSLIMRNMDVQGDIRNDDIYRNLYIDMTDTTVNGAMVSSTAADWNANFTVEALKASPAYEIALEMIDSWADEVPNATYDADYPYADFVLDLDTVSANLSVSETAAVRGIHLTMNDGAVWYVRSDSQLVSLDMADGAVIQFPLGVEYSIYIDCDGLDPAMGTQIDSLPAGSYENVVIVFGDPIGNPVASEEGSGEASF